MTAGPSTSSVSLPAPPTPHPLLREWRVGGSEIPFGVTARLGCGTVAVTRLNDSTVPQPPLPPQALPTLPGSGCPEAGLPGSAQVFFLLLHTSFMAPETQPVTMVPASPARPMRGDP
ncbi:hypothetical protein SKAU_G00044230 [Synaphobranchus kaupii]|uniref:Uncharacterized protein n=1 Tax=Synaphobranchus kaupii TaxID=118154 RepID=A0A9Q1G2K4_SYNKA|nr:hypothetical protein SKAU_G00044230 [Synaphobranchus kaupii]